MYTKHLFKAAKLIEQDGIQAMNYAIRLVGKDVALAFLIAYQRRNLGSADTYPANEEIDPKVYQFLLDSKLLEVNIFRGENRFWSNFWLHPIRAFGYECKSNEHGFQALMTLDEDVRQKILAFPTPREAKMESMNEDFPLRHDWANVQIDIMRELINQKFSLENSHELAYKMYQSFDFDICEGNNWGDTYWGICDGVGENNLGKLLTEKRNEVVLFVAYIKACKLNLNRKGVKGVLEDVNDQMVDKPISETSLIKWLQILGVTG
jgi:predicted NAD-dependent protein-ADP-ribosyltransferase YbiA (DUF1768 family)